MSMKIIHGNIFDSQCRFLVNPVNCEGVMGKGLAKEFKERYPEIMAPYMHVCARKRNRLRPMSNTPYCVCKTNTDKMVINFATKNRWRESTKMEYIDHGLADLYVTGIQIHGIDSIAFPALGCGCGGLNWDDVRPVMMNHLMMWPDDITIEIYIK